MQPQQKDSESSAGGTKRSVVDRVVGQIRELVVSRGLSIGDSLPTENELAVMFGASRNTVREALDQLELRGMIRRRAGSGGCGGQPAPGARSECGGRERCPVG